LACLVAFGLGGGHSLGHAVSLGGGLFALFLGGLFLVSQSGAQLGGLASVDSFRASAFASCARTWSSWPAVSLAACC
jgi:hypothetical protein